MSRSLRASAAAALLAVGALGCPESKQDSHPSTPPHSSAGPTASARGIKVPLPPGWAARATPEEALVAGPAGKAVLRIELWSSAPSLPSAQALIDGFTSRAGGVRSTVIDARSEDDHSLAVIEVATSPDAGATAGKWLTLLGAKRVEKDVFLCSTVPGATEEEVKASSAACAALARPE